MSTIGLANETDEPITLNLPAAVVPELATRAVAAREDHNFSIVRSKGDASAPQAGARRVRAARRSISGSVTLRPRGKKGSEVLGLPASVLQAPDVKAALGARRVRRVEESAPPAGPPREPGEKRAAQAQVKGAANKTAQKEEV